MLYICPHALPEKPIGLRPLGLASWIFTLKNKIFALYIIIGYSVDNVKEEGYNISHLSDWFAGTGKGIFIWGDLGWAEDFWIGTERRIPGLAPC